MAAREHLDAAASWANVARSATRMRDHAIREAVHEGVSVREVARGVGMSHSGVARVVARGNDESTPARP